MSTGKTILAAAIIVAAIMMFGKKEVTAQPDTSRAAIAQMAGTAIGRVLNDKPWRASLLNVLDGKASSPAEQYCKQILDTQQAICRSDAAIDDPRCAESALAPLVQSCDEGLRREWLTANTPKCGNPNFRDANGVFQEAKLEAYKQCQYELGVRRQDCIETTVKSGASGPAVQRTFEECMAGLQ